MSISSTSGYLLGFHLNIDELISALGVKLVILNLMVIPSLIGVALWRESSPSIAIILGLTIFGFVFAMNSSTHSYMILAYSDNEKVSLNVGFYYMANAAGRLVGTLLSGLLFMIGRNPSIGLQYCLYFSSLLILLSWISSLKLPSIKQSLSSP